MLPEASSSLGLYLKWRDSRNPGFWDRTAKKVQAAPSLGIWPSSLPFWQGSCRPQHWGLWGALHPLLPRLSWPQVSNHPPPVSADTSCRPLEANLNRPVASTDHVLARFSTSQDSRTLRGSMLLRGKWQAYGPFYVKQQFASLKQLRIHCPLRPYMTEHTGMHARMMSYIYSKLESRHSGEKPSTIPLVFITSISSRVVSMVSYSVLTLALNLGCKRGVNTWGPKVLMH